MEKPELINSHGNRKYKENKKDSEYFRRTQTRVPRKPFWPRG